MRLISDRSGTGFGVFFAMTERPVKRIQAGHAGQKRANGMLASRLLRELSLHGALWLLVRNTK